MGGSQLFDRAVFERDVSTIVSIAGEWGLDFLDVEFFLCPSEVISFIAAYSLPTRFSHWSFGKSFRKLVLQQRHGLACIHELVYFSVPCQAFVSEGNSPVENMIVAAHVIAHADFFKNNVNFWSAGKHTALVARTARSFIQECISRFGPERVERVLDAALALRYYPELLEFIACNSPVLEDWQRQVIKYVREESCYFFQLLETKFLNEGWAAYWHTQILRAMDLDVKEAVEFARVNAAALEVSCKSVNPYRLGLDLFTAIRRTLGIQELFAIRRGENDFSFFQKYLSRDIIKELGLTGYSFRKGSASEFQLPPEEIKRHFVHGLGRCGLPDIGVDKERTSGGRLYLRHVYDGRPLHVYSAKKTLEQISSLWGGSVALNTRQRGRDVVFIFDKTGHSSVIL
jgi:stage V sporulation protein R